MQKIIWENINSQYPKKGLILWFTLVELIVVITILAILGTIGFISIQGYSSSARDSSRISNLVNLQKGLSLFNVAGGSYPMPESPITITASGTVIGYQGFARDQVAGIAKLSAGATRDPLDTGMYTTYATNALQTKMQVMAFLEDGSKVTGYVPGVEEAVAAGVASYVSRSPLTKGDTLGILIGTGANMNQPVQELLTASFTGVDVVNTGTGYTAVFSKTDSVSGTGSKLKIIDSFMKQWSAKNCNELLQFDGNSGKDGIYSINPDGKKSFNVYCDMTTDGGGWTLVTRQIIGFPYSWNIIFNDYSTNIASKHYSFDRSFLYTILQDKPTVQSLYKSYSGANILTGKYSYNLWNENGYFIAKTASDKIGENVGNKDASAFLINFSKSTNNAYYEPKLVCGAHTRMDQYWYDSPSWIYTDWKIVYFSVYDGCTGGTYPQGSSVINNFQDVPYSSTANYQELYVRF